jgi:hypothetical protein
MRAREYEWLQYKNGAITKETWETYRGVIYFVLGTERSRAALARLPRLLQSWFRGNGGRDDERCSGNRSVGSAASDPVDARLLAPELTERGQDYRLGPAAVTVRSPPAFQPFRGSPHSGRNSPETVIDRLSLNDGL